MMVKHIFSFIVLSVLLGFGLGYYYQGATRVETGRDLASIKRDGKVDPKLTQALKECLNDRSRENHIDLSKVDVDGRSFSTVSLDCLGDKAKNLYDAIAPFADEQYVRYSDGRRGVGRFFGRLYPPSQCVRVIRTSKGAEMNLYSCSIMLDLDYDLIRSFKP